MYINPILKKAILKRCLEVSKNFENNKRRNKAVYLASSFKKRIRNKTLMKARKLALLSNELSESVSNIYGSICEDARNLAEGLSFYVSKTVHDKPDDKKIISAMNKEIEKFLSKYKEKIKKVVKNKI